MTSMSAFSEELSGILKESGAKGYLLGMAKNFYNGGKALVTNPSATIREGLKEGLSLEKGKRFGTAMNVVSAGSAVADAAPAEDPTGQGRSRVQRLGAGAGRVLGGMVPSRYGAMGSIAGSMIGEGVGATGGKILDKARGYKPPAGTISNESRSQQVGR